MTQLKETTREEFNAVLKYCDGLGIDVGCGTNRLDKSVLALDHFPHVAKAGEFGANDMVLDCAKLPFRDNVFDFVFSSHCLEDFEPGQIKAVLTEWLRCVKIQGRLVLLLPDMEGGRYPRVGAKDGNPSHRVDVGPEYMKRLIQGLPVEIEQIDTIDKTRFFTFDIVLKKTGGLKNG